VLLGETWLVPNEAVRCIDPAVVGAFVCLAGTPGRATGVRGVGVALAEALPAALALLDVKLVDPAVVCCIDVLPSVEPTHIQC
jgi:hypothetical protein